MADQLTVTTLYARQQMAKARAEGTKLTKVVKMAFGNGGTKDGKPISLDGTEQKLKKNSSKKRLIRLPSWNQQKSATPARSPKENLQEKSSTN